MNKYSEAQSMFKNITSKVKQMALNKSQMEIKVLEATNDEPWGPTATQMQDICKLSYEPVNYPDMVRSLFFRLSERGAKWRMVYKALLVSEYLIRNGPVSFSKELRQNDLILQELANFDYIDVKGKDQGINVKHRAKEILFLVSNENLVREEREKSEAARKKYGGLSSQDYAQPRNEIDSKITPESDDPNVNPFEATKQRIQNLKAGISREEEHTGESFFSNSQNNKKYSKYTKNSKPLFGGQKKPSVDRSEVQQNVAIENLRFSTSGKDEVLSKPKENLFPVYVEPKINASTRRLSTTKINQDIFNMTDLLAKKYSSQPSSPQKIEMQEAQRPQQIQSQTSGFSKLPEDLKKQLSDYSQQLMSDSQKKVYENQQKLNMSLNQISKELGSSFNRSQDKIEEIEESQNRVKSLQNGIASEIKNIAQSITLNEYNRQISGTSQQSNRGNLNQNTQQNNFKLSQRDEIQFDDESNSYTPGSSLKNVKLQSDNFQLNNSLNRQQMRNFLDDESSSFNRSNNQSKDSIMQNNGIKNIDLNNFDRNENKLNNTINRQQMQKFVDDESLNQIRSTNKSNSFNQQNMTPYQHSNTYNRNQMKHFVDDESSQQVNQYGQPNQGNNLNLQNNFQAPQQNSFNRKQMRQFKEDESSHDLIKLDNRNNTSTYNNQLYVPQKDKSANPQDTQFDQIVDASKPNNEMQELSNKTQPQDIKNFQNSFQGYNTQNPSNNNLLNNSQEQVNSNEFDDNINFEQYNNTLKNTQQNNQANNSNQVDSVPKSSTTDEVNYQSPKSGTNYQKQEKQSAYNNSFRNQGRFNNLEVDEKTGTFKRPHLFSTAESVEYDNKFQSSNSSQFNDVNLANSLKNADSISRSTGNYQNPETNQNNMNNIGTTDFQNTDKSTKRMDNIQNVFSEQKLTRNNSDTIKFDDELDFNSLSKTIRNVSQNLDQKSESPNKTGQNPLQISKEQNFDSNLDPQNSFNSSRGSFLDQGFKVNKTQPILNTQNSLQQQQSKYANTYPNLNSQRSMNQQSNNVSTLKRNIQGDKQDSSIFIQPYKNPFTGKDQGSQLEEYQRSLSNKSDIQKLGSLKKAQEKILELQNLAKSSLDEWGNSSFRRSDLQNSSQRNFGAQKNIQHQESFGDFYGEFSQTYRDQYKAQGDDAISKYFVNRQAF